MPSTSPITPAAGTVALPLPGAHPPREVAAGRGQPFPVVGGVQDPSAPVLARRPRGGTAPRPRAEAGS